MAVPAEVKKFVKKSKKLVKLETDYSNVTFLYDLPLKQRIAAYGVP
jgi:hypothetical protein